MRTPTANTSSELMAMKPGEVNSSPNRSMPSMANRPAQRLSSRQNRPTSRNARSRMKALFQAWRNRSS
ncbi:hypothetical protein D3C78_1772690 [compost metagenome]